MTNTFTGFKTVIFIFSLITYYNNQEKQRNQGELGLEHNLGWFKEDNHNLKSKVLLHDGALHSPGLISQGGVQHL